MTELSAPLIGVVRHRLETDGEGVTTLVAFHGCPLHCRHCLNPQCLRPDGARRSVTVRQLLDEVSVDDLYFQATGGGICFGGGEPLLHADFIAAFCQACPAEWKMSIETSLHADLGPIQKLLPHIDTFFVDVKDLNPDIYHRYTQRDISPLRENLLWLSQHADRGRIVLRLPLIPGFNTSEDVARSRAALEAMGFSRLVELTYIT